MGSITYIDAIAIWSLVYYVLSLPLGLYVSFRHGFGKNSGWIFLVIFAIIRIIGSAAQLATINSTSETPITIAGVMSALGLSPLLLASIGFLSRV
jgi:hypothetical protein